MFAYLQNNTSAKSIIAATCAALLLLCFSFSSRSAEITIRAGFIIDIIGEIKSSDVQRVRQLPREITTFTLSSNGGDVIAAMEIGRIIRERKALVIVPSEANCYSSCALIYIAGVNRMNLGVVGLHRPYLVGEPSSPQEIKEYIPNLLMDIRKYVKEMGVTIRFNEIMINTPPESMRRFRADAIDEIVPRQDPLNDEIEVAYRARRYGITTEEYRSRKALVHVTCQHNIISGDRAGSCIQASYWGLSMSVYEKRDSEAYDKCPVTEEQKTTARQARKEGLEWRDHPIAKEREKCVIKVMLRGG